MSTTPSENSTRDTQIYFYYNFKYVDLDLKHAYVVNIAPK